MARLIIISLAAIVLVFAVTFVAAAIRSRQSTSIGARKEDPMPDTMKTFAYVLLILLMFGITTGWIGGL